MTSKAAQMIQCAKIVRVITCHPQNYVLKEKEILKLKLKESSTSIMYLKPNMPSYASAYASALEVTTQDSLTQTGESI